MKSPTEDQHASHRIITAVDLDCLWEPRVRPGRKILDPVDLHLPLWWCSVLANMTLRRRQRTKDDRTSDKYCKTAAFSSVTALLPPMPLRGSLCECRKWPRSLTSTNDQDEGLKLMILPVSRIVKHQATTESGCAAPVGAHGCDRGRASTLGLWRGPLICLPAGCWQFLIWFLLHNTSRRGDQSVHFQPAHLINAPHRSVLVT